MMIEIKDLGLGDVVRLDMGQYGDATVRKRNGDGTVVVVRPFIHTGNFEYTGGVLWYVGIEEVTLHGAPVILVRKGDKLK